jgi:peroxidase
MEVMIIFMVALVLALHGTETLSSVDHGPLAVDYYKESCPLVEDIVRRSVQTAVFKDPRMAASLLRLHFHDCFVMVSPLSLSLSLSVCVCVCVKILLVIIGVSCMGLGVRWFGSFGQ